MAVLAAAAFYTHYDNDALAAIFQSSSLIQPANLQQGLVGWYPFDGKDISGTTAIDHGSAGNNATLAGVKPTAGKIGQGLFFSGVSFGSYAYLNGASGLDDIQQLTLSAWIKPNSTFGNIAQKRTGVGKGWELRVGGGALQFFRSFTGGEAEWDTQAFPINEWTHVVVTYDDTSASNLPTFYINGVATTTIGGVASGSLLSDTPGTVYISNLLNPFSGVMDDVRIYNRILSPQEVQYLYQYGQVKVKSVAGNGPLPTPVTLDSSGNVNALISIAQGADGFPVISYHDVTNSKLNFVKCNDAACVSYATSTLDSGGLIGVGEMSSIAIGRDGFPVISYFDQTNNHLNFAKCNDASCSTVATSSLDLAGDTGHFTSIAIGADGFPVISYESTVGQVLKFLKCNDAACTSTTIRTLDSFGGGIPRFTSIAIGRDRFPVISYYDNFTFDLKFAKCNDASCAAAATSTLDSAGDVGFYNAVAIGSDGFPIIAYRDTTHGKLNIAKCNDAACLSYATSTVDSANNVGQFLSIAIAADGYPMVSYNDLTNNALKFAKYVRAGGKGCDVSTWTCVTLDAIGGLPKNTSIARGIDGFPILSYRDSVNNTLKFLHCNAYCGSITTIGKSQESVVPGGLVGYWSFNGKNTHWLTNTTDDLSGQGNTGTMVNMSMSTSPTPGRIGQGLRFVNGDDPSVSVVQTSSINDLTNKTITAWIKPTSLGQSNHGTVVGKYSSPNGWMLRLESVLSQPRLDFYQSFSGNDGEWDCSTNLAYGDWQFVAVTYNNSATGNTPTFNINGTACSGTLVSPATGSADSDSSINLSIGNITGNTLDFDGAIDEVRIYNRILSAQEIKALYNAGR